MHVEIVAKTTGLGKYENLFCGVYKIENIITKDCYIGSSRDIEKRKTQHFNSLRRGKHHSMILQRAYDKYGHTNLELKILEVCESKHLEDIENQYLKEIDPMYNLCPRAYTTKGVRCSQEKKDKLRQRNLIMGITPPSKTWMDKRRPVQQIDKNSGLVIAEFESASAAARALGRPSYCATNVSKVCLGKRELIYNFKWKFNNESTVSK